jgi:hypothetical protein
MAVQKKNKTLGKKKSYFLILLKNKKKKLTKFKNYLVNNKKLFFN